MTEKIQHIIEDIRSRKRTLDAVLNSEKIKRAESEQEVRDLTSQLASCQQEVETLKQTVVRLQAELEKAKNQVVIPDNQPVSKDVQIDELVREIEYCIGQLKNNA